MLNSNGKHSDIEKEREELIKLFNNEYGFITDDINASILYSNYEIESNKIEFINIIKGGFYG